MKPAKILLTPKERQVLHLLSKGFTYKEISAPMNVSPETVKKHLKNIYKNLNASNKIEALQKVKLLEPLPRKGNCFNKVFISFLCSD